MSAPGRWDNAALASGACLGAGAALLVAGFWYHWAALALAGAVFTGAAAGSAAVTVTAMLNWHRAHGSEVCCVYRLRLHGRVRHLHWPAGKRGDCRHPVGFRANLRQRIE